MIYTLTFHHAHNYGAMLQAYALQQALFKLNINTEIIDYYDTEETIFIKGFDRWTVHYNLSVLLSYSRVKRAYKRFEEFNKKYLVTTDHFDTLDAIKDKLEPLSKFVVGSDQLWKCPPGARLSKFFSLAFLDQYKDAITYAVSMGGYHKLEKSNYSEFQTMLRKFSHVSVREKSTCEFLSNEFGIKTTQHIDPVFLIDKEDWATLAEKAVRYSLPKEYIVCYELVPNILTQRALDKLKILTGLQTVVITRAGVSKLKADYVIKDAGPLEFVRLLKNATYVVTTSFHGTAFGNLFNKKTFVILPNNSERMMSLLKLLGTECFGLRNIDTIDELLAIDINYETVNSKILKEQIRSQRYFVETLGAETLV